ncbi:hypothetical protein R1flu_023438 [Riccia fluitans]|uniref:Transposase n=1 Tax=Riccia fluitans TaxID=41844 RepID=A0ABD1XV12_9MARC
MSTYMSLEETTRHETTLLHVLEQQVRIAARPRCPDNEREICRHFRQKARNSYSWNVNHTGSNRRHRKVAELPGPLCLGYTLAQMQQKAVQIKDQDLLPRNLRLNRTGSRILHRAHTR